MKRRILSLAAVVGFALLAFSLVGIAQPITSGGGLSRVSTTGSAFEGSGTQTNPLKMRTDCATGSGVAWNGTTWQCAALGSGPTVISPTAITGTVNDWAPAGYTAATTVIRVDTSGTVTLTGITGGSAGRVLDLQFIGANNVTLTNQTSSTAANQIITGYSTPLTFTQSQNVRLVYDGTTSRWRVSSFSGVSLLNNVVTNNFFPKFSGAIGGLQNSSMFDNGTTVSVSNVFATTGNTTIGDAVGDTLSVSATTTHTGPTSVGDFRGVIITPSSLGTSQNDWNPTSLATAQVINASSSTTVNITGLAGGAEGRKVTLFNSGSQIINIPHDSASSTAANRIYAADGNAIVLEGGYDGVVLEYLSSRWRVVQKFGRFQGSMLFNGAFAAYSTASLYGSSITFGDATTDAISVIGNMTTGDTRGAAIAPTGLTGTINDWAPASLATARVIQVTASATATITGLTGGAAGRALTLCNVGTQSIQLANENVGSSAANRFRLPAAQTLLIPYTSYWSANGYECIELVYDGTLSRWTVAADGTTTRAQFETRSQLYNAGTMTTIGNATFGSNITAGNDGDDLTTFSNGPRGINAIDGKHVEWIEEWLAPDANIGVGEVIGNFQYLGTGGIQQGARANAVGVATLKTNSSATAYAILATAFESIYTATAATSIFETAQMLEDVSVTDTQEFQVLHGFFDTSASANQTDGCYFLYDRGHKATAAGTGSRGTLDSEFWQCWCASNGTRTAYKMDGTVVSSGSFTTVAVPSSEEVWQRFRVVVTGTSLAEFYYNGTKTCQISTNVPAANRQMGAGHQLIKVAGTTNRMVHVDYTRLDMLFPSTRSP